VKNQTERELEQLEKEYDARKAREPKPAIGACFYGSRVVDDDVGVSGPFSPGEAWLDLKIRILASGPSLNDIGALAPYKDCFEGHWMVHLNRLADAWGWTPETVLEFISFLRTTNQIRPFGNHVRLAHTLLRPNDPTWMRQ